MSEEPIPFFVPDLGADEIEEVVRTLQSGWLTTGAKTEQFENDFAASVGARFAVAVNSATAALHLALEACGVGPDDEVIVPTLTFAATAEVVLHLGARPVLVDCTADTLNMDPEKVATAITPRTKAILPMHYGGHPCDMDPLMLLAKSHDLAIVEDAAHAFPAAYRGRKVGTLGEATCYSFYANKTITTGEGGMLVTDKEAIASRARLMSLHGLSQDAWKRFAAEGSWYYEIEEPGFKYNLTDIAASLGIHQLKRAESMRTARERVAQYYSEALRDVAEIELPALRADVQHAWHLYAIKLRLETLTIDRAEFIRLLAKAKIGASVHWMPLHMHPYYRQHGFPQDDFPIATTTYPRLVSLPIFPSMTTAQRQRVVETVVQIIREHRR